MSNDLFGYIERIGEYMPGGFFVYVADEKEDMIYVNNVVLDMFGCDTLDEFKELTGYTFNGIVYPEDLDGIQNSIKVQVGHNEKRLDYVEYRIMRKDGQVRWVDDYGRLVKTDEYGEVYFVLIRDITDLKKQENDRYNIEKSLEKEKHLNDMRKDFLYNVSQDIKTPMSTIEEYTNLAMKSMDDPEKLREYLEKINASNKQMISVSENLLDMSLLDSGRVHIKEVPSDISRVVGDAVGVFSEAAMAKNIELKKRISVRRPNVYLDQDNFNKILYNILSNAIKFTDNNGTVSVIVRDGHASESGYVRYEIEIADTGIGMSDEFLDKLYNAFSTEGDMAEATGIGIGLSIAKKLVDAMGGTISVTSKKKEGSSFVIGLPLKLSDDTSAPDKNVSKHILRPRADKQRLLLAEDEELNRVLARDILSTAGYDVDVVSDGSDAIKAIENHPENYYSLILMDIHMPIMNGNEAVRLIRSMGRADTASIPIIGLSKNARGEEKKESIESGMNAHLAKPFDMTNLIDTIKIYLKSF